MSNQHSKCDDCYKTHLPENHDRTILPSEAFSEGYVPEFKVIASGNAEWARRISEHYGLSAVHEAHRLGRSVI